MNPPILRLVILISLTGFAPARAVILVTPGLHVASGSQRLADLTDTLEDVARTQPESFPEWFQFVPVDSGKLIGGPSVAMVSPAFVALVERSESARDLAPDLFPLWLHLQFHREKIAQFATVEPVAKRPPDSAEGCLRRAAALIAEKKRAEAIPLLLRAQALKPRDFSLALRVGGMLQAPDSWDAAQTFAEQLVARYPKRIEAWQLLAAVCAQRGVHEEALGAVRNARQLNPKSAALWFAEGSANVVLQRWDEAAIKLVQAVRLDPKNERYWRSLTDCYRSSRDLLAGEFKLKQLIEAFPTSAPAWYSLGCVQVAGGLRQGGLKSWQKAIELRPKYADAWSQIGVLQLADGDRKGALEAIERALKADPKHAEASNNRGWILLSEDKLEPAIAHFQTALKSDPTYARAMVNLIRALAKKGDLEQANAVCDRLIQLNPAAGEKLRGELGR